MKLTEWTGEEDTTTLFVCDWFKCYFHSPCGQCLYPEYKRHFEEENINIKLYYLGALTL